jgi:elongation factor G
MTGYVFKILYDAEMGPLAYTRIYSGELKKAMNLMNASVNSPEKIGHIYRVRANQYVPVHHIHTGDIVAISGLK